MTMTGVHADAPKGFIERWLYEYIGRLAQGADAAALPDKENPAGEIAGSPL